MKQITYYYLRKNDPLVWLSAAFMLLSAILCVIVYCSAPAETGGVFSGLLLPLSANLSFLPILLFCGERRLYKTSLPVSLCCLFLAFQAFRLPSVLYIWVGLMLSICTAFLWRRTVDGKLSARYLRVFLVAAPLLFHLIVIDLPLLRSGNRESALWLPHISVLSMLLSLIITAIAMKKRPEGSGYYPRRGDRNDGRRIRSLPPISAVTPYIMVNRNGATNFVFDKVECTGMEEYIRQKRREGLENFGTTHVFMAAYARAVAKMPALNRFLSGQKVYSRGEEIEISMVVKKEMNLQSPDTAITVYLSPWDTADDVYHKLNQQIQEAKNTPLDSSFDNLAGVIGSIPGLLLKFTVWLLKTLDYFGLLPRWLTKLSPFHGSLFVTSMGSLGIPPICHHLYDFGNMPVFCAFGKRRRETEIKADGTIVKRKYIDFNFNTDERICDGFYFATALKEIKKTLADPSRLDEPPKEVIRDID